MAYKIVCDVCKKEIEKRVKFKTMYQNFDVEIRVHDNMNDADLCHSCLTKIFEIIKLQTLKEE